MRLIIVPSDNRVVIDGDARTVDCAAAKALGVHAVQWYGADGYVENNSGGSDHITKLPLWCEQLVADHAAAPVESEAPAAPGRNYASEIDALAARVAAIERKP